MRGRPVELVLERGAEPRALFGGTAAADVAPHHQDGLDLAVRAEADDAVLAQLAKATVTRPGSVSITSA